MCAHLVHERWMRRRTPQIEGRPGSAPDARPKRAGCAPGWARPADLKIDCKSLFLDERLAHYLILASLVNEIGGGGYGDREKTLVRQGGTQNKGLTRGLKQKSDTRVLVCGEDEGEP